MRLKAIIFNSSSVKYLIAAAIFFGFISGCRRDVDLQSNQRVVVDYWEKWSGYELEAARDIVEAFNKSQEHIYVNLLSVSEIERKLLIAIAGSDPPDIANLQDWLIPQFADKNALESFDSLLPSIGVKRQDYIDIYWKLCQHQGRLYGLPLAPTTVALHWNKSIFSNAGFNPDVAPQTLEQLDIMAKQITAKIDSDNYRMLGFVPTQPGWWNYAWVWWFGGHWWDGQSAITANCAENVRAFEWVQSYAKTYGARALQNFTSGFGAFSWSDDRFMSEKLAMVLQGVWMSGFIDKLRPQMDWAAGAFPSSGGRLKDVTMAECNVLVIPRGAKHKKEAVEFIKFLQKPENLSHIAIKQNKFMPLKIANTADYSDYPNKEIKLFIRLSQSSNVHSVPRIPIWPEYAHEIDNAFQSVWLQKITPKQALEQVQKNVELKWLKYRNLKAKQQERQ